MNGIVNHKEFKKKCIDAGINYNTAISYKYQHPTVKDEDIIKMYKDSSGRENSLLSKCSKLGLNYKKVVRYKMNNTKMSDDELIKTATDNKWFSLKAKCLDNEVSFYKVNKLLKENTEITEEDAINIVKGVKNNE